MKSPHLDRSFHDLNAHGFVRVALAVPQVALADPAENAKRTGELLERANSGGAAITLFPELGLAGYSLDDLHQQDALLGAVRTALSELIEQTRDTSGLLVVGAPLRFHGRLYNCAVVIGAGTVLGIVPKSYLPNYREFYEKRQFASALDAPFDHVNLDSCRVPFGADLVFQDAKTESLCLHVEICEDLWVPIPPSTYGAFAGATLLANLSASNVTIGKAGYRRELVSAQSAKSIAAYLYTAAGSGESTTDLAWDGHALAYEYGEQLCESHRFSKDSQLLFADVDLDRIVQERSRQSSFIDCATRHQSQNPIRVVKFEYRAPREALELDRTFDRYPFVPTDESLRNEHCREAYEIQVAGLTQRLSAARLDKLVLGLSGGLDSTHALLVAARAMEHLGHPPGNILCYSMPGYATSKRTAKNAERLASGMGVSFEEIDIRPSCMQMFKDIGHPFADGEKTYDVTFENVQAGERTSHLFRLANRHSALVLGTGDLSELALGWCTYGVGDQMSHYGVNASVPKSLVRYLIRWVASEGHLTEEANAALHDVLDTVISPELVPGDGEDEPEQDTEAVIGPYELHDFFLYYTTRRGYSPGKVLFLAWQAWKQAPENKYTLEEIHHWLGVFLKRFFETSQFKRSALPNGPKVGSGGSLSPRSDWRAPSDSRPTPWLDEHARTWKWIERS